VDFRSAFAWLEKHDSACFVQYLFTCGGDAPFHDRAFGLEIEAEEPDFAILRTGGGDNVVLFSPRGPQTPEQFSAAPTVTGFLVDDIDAVREQLLAAGTELLGDLSGRRRPDMGRSLSSASR
jgi:hypothetical protein